MKLCIDQHERRRKEMENLIIKDLSFVPEQNVITV